MEENILWTLLIQKKSAKATGSKKEKCKEAKAAMRDILSDEQFEKFDGVFDNVVGKVLKGILLKEKN